MSQILDSVSCPGLTARNPRPTTAFQRAFGRFLDRFERFNFIAYYVVALVSNFFLRLPIVILILYAPMLLMVGGRAYLKRCRIPPGFSEAKLELLVRQDTWDTWEGSMDYRRFVRRARMVLRRLGWASDRFVPWDDARAVLEIPENYSADETRSEIIRTLADEFEDPSSVDRSIQEGWTLGQVLQNLYRQTREPKLNKFLV